MGIAQLLSLSLSFEFADSLSLEDGRLFEVTVDTQLSSLRSDFSLSLSLEAL